MKTTKDTIETPCDAGDLVRDLIAAARAAERAIVEDDWARLVETRGLLEAQARRLEEELRSRPDQGETMTP